MRLMELNIMIYLYQNLQDPLTNKQNNKYFVIWTDIIVYLKFKYVPTLYIYIHYTGISNVDNNNIIFF